MLPNGGRGYSALFLLLCLTIVCLKTGFLGAGRPVKQKEVYSISVDLFSLVFEASRQ
jgi:hypothetical protein